MVWYASPVSAWAAAKVLRCTQPKGALVRAGVEKSSGLVLKLAVGMEVVVDAEAVAMDGTPRVRVVDPVRGWASTKTLAVVESAVAESYEDRPRPSREADVVVRRWASATAPRREAWAALDLEAEEDDGGDVVLSIARALRVAGGHDCGGGGSGHASVPIFYIPEAATTWLAVLPAVAEARRRPPTVEAVEGVDGCFLASDVFDERQCARLVALSAAMGLRVAELDKGDALRRNATQQCVFVDADRAIRSALDVVLPLVPAAGGPHWMSSGSPTQNGAAPKSAHAPLRLPEGLLGLNAKCRFLRYADGDAVQPHHDTAWQGCDPDKGMDAVLPDALSWLTAIAYLNDGFEGGETTFFVERETDGRRDGAAAAADHARVAVAPKRGAVLLFFHGHHKWSPLHEGSVANGTTKHVLRTDVLYRAGRPWQPPPPRDKSQAPPPPPQA